MKKLFLLFFVGMFFSVSAQERVSLALQESKEIYQPFSIQSYKATPEGKIKISEVAENKLLITGLSQGECELYLREFHLFTQGGDVFGSNGLSRLVGRHWR